jgi:hypothetical protein
MHHRGKFDGGKIFKPSNSGEKDFPSQKKNSPWEIWINADLSGEIPTLYIRVYYATIYAN